MLGRIEWAFLSWNQALIFKANPSRFTKVKSLNIGTSFAAARILWPSSPVLYIDLLWTLKSTFEAPNIAGEALGFVEVS